MACFTYVECGVSVKSILKVLPEPHTVEAKRLHTFVLYITGEVEHRRTGIIMYSNLAASIDRVLNNILNSLPSQFTSAQFIKAVSYYCAPQYQQVLTHTTFRGLHSWIARWYLTSNSRITKVANGQRQIETINGNKSTNALWNNPVKN
jgi:hypothetical protein